MTMRILNDAEPLGDPPVPVSLALGFFDGVHTGHAAVIRRMLTASRSAGSIPAVVTFDRHPASVVAPERAPLLIYPLWRRLAAMEELGVDTTLVFPFDTAFSRQSGEEFIERLLQGFGQVESVTVGSGFVFGHRRSGDLDLLRRLGEIHGFAIHEVPPQQIDGETVSSTRVRECVMAGAFEIATSLLGRPYSLNGSVIGGDRVGRKLGFPTANLDITGLVIPPAGVYAAVAHGTGLLRPAAVNIGRRPSLHSPQKELTVEAHLLEFQGDLYGTKLELEMHQRLREEKAFDSMNSLTRQIGEDVASVRQWAGNMGLL